ncbi:MAG TPA: carboxylating nicotinate-nucleotide diphosphorylase [Acidimicrobiales bacterium]|nr:carboxylating nicotinate-nucleotide diphosphorylase [Acidimicrobiales bacterium]
MQPPIGAVRAAVARALDEDLTPLGDITSGLLPAGVVGAADFVARERGVLAGVACATEVFAQIDDTVIADWAVTDGADLGAGQVIGHVSGPLSSILTAERTALNFLGHLSGVATLTHELVVATGGGARIWDTRKTTPGLRALEKAAVRAGGGSNHRGNLSDWVLLKDNHLTVLGIEDAVRLAHERWPGRTVHVECDSLDQVAQALKAGADALLLDNMTPDEVQAAVELSRQADEPRPLLEVSGGVTRETVRAYAQTGADCISVGAITNSAPVLDIGLDIEVNA